MRLAQGVEWLQSLGAEPPGATLKLLRFQLEVRKALEEVYLSDGGDLVDGGMDEEVAKWTVCAVEAATSEEELEQLSAEIRAYQV